MDASSDALNLNASNTKALFRRANAYANLNFIEEAIDTLNIAHQIDPNDEVNFKIQIISILQESQHALPLPSTKLFKTLNKDNIGT